MPEIEAMKAGKPVLGLLAGAAFDIQIVDEPARDENPDPSKAH